MKSAIRKLWQSLCLPVLWRRLLLLPCTTPQPQVVDLLYIQLVRIIFNGSLLRINVAQLWPVVVHRKQNTHTKKSHDKVHTVVFCLICMALTTRHTLQTHAATIAQMTRRRASRHPAAIPVPLPVLALPCANPPSPLYPQPLHRPTHPLWQHSAATAGLRRTACNRHPRPAGSPLCTAANAVK